MFCTVSLYVAKGRRQISPLKISDGARGAEASVGFLRREIGEQIGGQKAQGKVGGMTQRQMAAAVGIIPDRPATSAGCRQWVQAIGSNASSGYAAGAGRPPEPFAFKRHPHRLDPAVHPRLVPVAMITE